MTKFISHEYNDRLLACVQIGGVPISSTKGSHGHLLGAAGAVESIFTILACHTGNLPPSLNIFNLDEDFKELNIVTSANYRIDHPPSKPVVALKNSFGFGGTNASLCFASFYPDRITMKPS